MAPEQAAAKKSLTTAVDVYSLGAILYEMLTGRPPFQAKTPLDTLMQVLEKEPERPRKLNLTIDLDLETICSEVPGEGHRARYDSAQDLALDLERWLRGEPIQARPVSSWEKARRWARRNPQVAALAAVLLLVTIGGFVAVLVLLREAEISAEDASAQKVIAQGERDTAKGRLWQSLLDQVRTERAAGSRWRSLDLVKEASSLTVSAELRQEAAQTAVSPGFRQVCQLGPYYPRRGTLVPVFSPDGSMIATPEGWQEGDMGRFVTGIKVWHMPDGKLLGQAECNNKEEHEGDFAFSPAEPIMALAVQGNVRLWEPKTGKEIGRFPGNGPVRFSPDGALLAVSFKAGGFLWDMRARTGNWQCAVPGTPVAFVSTDKLPVRAGGQCAW